MAAKKKPKTAKLPGALKVDVYANVAAASADLIVAGCNSAPKISAWAPERGAVILDKPFHDGLSFRATPREQGLAALPGGRFAQASNHVNYDKGYPGTFGVFDLDGAVVGTLRTGSWDAVAASPAGDLVAVSTIETEGTRRVAVFHTEELIAGGKPFVELPKLDPLAQCFTHDAKALVSYRGGVLTVAPLDGSSPKTFPVESRTQTGEVISVSGDGVVCVSDQGSALLVTLGGKKLHEWQVHLDQHVEHAMITRDGLVIAAAGALLKKYDKSFARGITFPDPKMAEGYVAVFDVKGKLVRWAPRAKNKPVRTMALSPGRAVVIGQDSFAELAPWPG